MHWEHFGAKITPLEILIAFLGLPEVAFGAKISLSPYQKSQKSTWVRECSLGVCYSYGWVYGFIGTTASTFSKNYLKILRFGVLFVSVETLFRSTWAFPPYDKSTLSKNRLSPGMLPRRLLFTWLGIWVHRNDSINFFEKLSENTTFWGVVSVRGNPLSYDLSVSP